MARKLKSDRVLFTTTILLVALSVVMVYSASAPVALERYGRASLFLIKQGMWALLGVAMLNIVMRIDYRAYRQPAFLWTALGFVVFALVAVYFRAPVNGARRWFAVGGIGIQPSELAKLVAIFLLPAPPHARVPQSLGRSARRRLPDHPVAHRRRHRRRVGPRADERRPEAVLPPRTAHRLHLRGDCRGARADRRHRRRDLLLARRLA